eukprot:TRINITY_DN15805_c2_g1_i2.p1 TRINITY_DN15805_c2_g1~~TRINITY_DN15805_c2_g1_i2.p1  ORF type:complete len:232 (+),score=47.73 TRINITY_DN15805_c2_g1_i2:33-728(+)
MVGKNNAVPKNHFRKNWAIRIKTWFDQPASKLRRRQNRALKAKILAPRPVAGSLRPIVRAPTVRYNRHLRAGRGFTHDELRVAKIDRKLARTLGISVDHRRRNTDESALQRNVKRLKAYRSKLVLFPRNSKKAGKTDAKPEDIKKATQYVGEILPIRDPSYRKDKARPVTEEMRKGSVYTKLRRARADAKLVGIRQKRNKKIEELKNSTTKKAAKGKGAAKGKAAAADADT